MLRVVLKTQFLTHLLHAGFDLLNMVRTVIAFSNDHVKMVLSRLLRIAYPLLEYLFSFLHVLTVQVDRIAVDLAHRIVLAEDVLRGLLVISVGLGGVLLALFTHAVRLGAVARLVCLACFRSEVLMLSLLFTREVA